VLGRNEKIVLILTGHQSKDAEYAVAYHQGRLESKTAGEEGLIQPRFANRPLRVAAEEGPILDLLAALLESSNSPTSSRMPEVRAGGLT
jgi:hypothetical protein